MQDISPNNNQQSATNTNTMNPRNLTAQSAGSISPTIISQSNADRRRRAANAREERRQESLAANVERAEIEKEYRRLREEERKANERAEARKKSVDKEKIWYWRGGWGNSPLERVNTTLGEKFFKKNPLQGAQETLKTPQKYSDYLTINNSSENNVNAAYQGLNELSDYITDLLKKEAEEKRRIDLARRTVAVMQGSAVSAPSYTPMSEEAVAAHYRIANDPNTDAETRQAMINDLKMDSEYVATHGGTNLSAAHEKYLSEDIYRGGSSVSKELKQTAGAYLAAAGSTFGKAEMNKAQSNIYVNQTEKARDTLLQRYQARDEINNPDNTAATTAALRANQENARKILDDLTESRMNLGLDNTEKRRLSAATEQQYAKQDARIKELLKDNPNVREEPSRMVESILRVSDGNRIDLSSDAFFREQAATERRFGSDWTSAGGKTAEDAISDGERSTAYSRFKSAADEATEYLLIDAEGKQRYTLKQDSGGAFSIFGWTGDLVASGQSAQGLPSALKNLNVPFDERNFNVLRPDSDSTLVELRDETDISGIGTAAAFKASVLGTFRGNEEIMKVEGERRAAEETTARQTALSNLDAALTDSQGYTLRIMGEPVDMPKTTAARKGEPNILSGAAVMASTMSGSLPLTMAVKGAYDLFTNPPKTILDEWAAEDAVTESAMRVDALTYGGRDGEKDVGGLFGSAREYADVVDSLVESGELVAGSKEKSLLLPDDDNPDNSVYTYTDLEWSDKASKESVEKFFNAESKLKSAGESLSAAISDYNAKVEKKEKISNDVWWGVPKVARDFTQTYLPEAEKVYPFINAAELLGSDLRKRHIVNEFVKDAISGKLKYDNSSDFVQKEVYDADPVLSWLYDYRYFRDEPVNYGIMVGAGYAAPYALTGGAKVIGKTMPHVRGTVIDPISNTQLAQKSSKYVSDVMKSIPPSPVSVRVGSANLLFNADKGLGGRVDSLMFIRRTGNYETATPIVSRLNYIQEGKVTGTRYFSGLNDGDIRPNTLSFGGMPYVLRESDKVAFAKAALENVGDTQSLERLKLWDLQSRYLQNSDPIVMQNIKPHIAEVLSAKGVKNADAVSNAVVNMMSKYRAYSQSSLTQRVIGEELGDIGLTRTPRDLDLFVEAADKFNDEVTAAINKAAGKDIVFVENGKVLMKSDRSELFDTHEMGQLDSLSAFAPGGVRMERYYVPGTKIQGTSLQTQFLNKRSGTGVLLPEPRVYSGAGAFDTGGSGIGYLMPAHAGRVKDVADYYIAGRVLANQMKLRGDKYADAFRDVLEKSIETYGDDTARQLRSEYESHLNRLQKSGVEMKVFEGEVIPVKDTPYFVRKPSKNLNPMNLDEKSFKNKGVEDAVKWTKANANANNLVGMPIGLYLTSSFVSSAAAKFAEGEESSREFVSREVVPMLVGGYFGGRGVQSLAKQLAFRGRTNYVPVEFIAEDKIIKGEELYPLFKYFGDEKSKTEYLKGYGRGGAAMKRAKDMGVTSENAKMFAFRGESQFPEEIRPGVSRVKATQYLDEDKSDVFSMSAASSTSLTFTRALEEEVFGYDLPFGLNFLPKSSKTPHTSVILSTQELANVPHGMGITRTEEFIRKNVPIGQFQGVSGKTAQYDRLIAEDEITTQPNAEYQIIDRSFRTKWFDKDIAVDVVGMVPKGAKETDVKIKVEANKIIEPTAKEQLENLDLTEELEYPIHARRDLKAPNFSWYLTSKARFRNVKNIYRQNAKNLKDEELQNLSEQVDALSEHWKGLIDQNYAQAMDSHLKLLDLKKKKGEDNFLNINNFRRRDSENIISSNKDKSDIAERRSPFLKNDATEQLIQKIDEFEKRFIDSEITVRKTRPKINARGRGGNPFTANAIMPNTKTGEYSKMSQIPTTTERKTPNIFTRESKPQSTGKVKDKGGGVESLFTKTSAKTTGFVESKPTTRNTGVFSFGTSTTPSYTTTKSTSAKTETTLFSSGSTRSTSRSGSSISRPSRSNSRAKSSGSKTSSSSGPKIFDTPMKRKTPKLRWDKNKDRRKKSYYNVFTVENVDLPILRGEEALTGQTLPKQELPANKKTIYQLGNIFTTKKPREYRKTNKKGFRI